MRSSLTFIFSPMALLATFLSLFQLSASKRFLLHSSSLFTTLSTMEGSAKRSLWFSRTWEREDIKYKRWQLFRLEMDKILLHVIASN